MIGVTVTFDYKDGFEAAFATMVEQANANHEFYDKSFLRWKVPDQPPPDLDLTAT